jgi:ATP synthase protein I
MSNPADDDRGGIPASERDAFKRRISELDAKLGRTKATAADKAAGDSGSVRATGRGMAVGMQMASEFVAAIVVGAVLGFGLDYAIGASGLGFTTSPGLLILFVLLGFAAGVLNLMRGYKRLQSDINRDTGSGIGKDLPDSNDDDDDQK